MRCAGQGENGDKFYVIKQGEAIVYQETAQGVRKVNHLFKADFFGERALLTDEPRCCLQLGVIAASLQAVLFAPVPAHLCMWPLLCILHCRRPYSWVRQHIRHQYAACWRIGCCLAARVHVISCRLSGGPSALYESCLCLGASMPSTCAAAPA